MNCNPSQCNPDAIDQYLHDDLTPDAEAAFESHLDSCELCRDAMQEQSGDADSWSEISTALRCSEYDSPAVRGRLSDSLAEGGLATVIPAGLLGPTDDPRMMGRIGPFEVAGCVGMGGMGVVFKVKDPSLDRYVALKMLAPHLAISPTARERFSREARASAAVVHDNVIAVHQVAEWRGLPYLVMPYLPGPSLEQRLQRDGRLGVIEALRIARQVAEGLAAAHEQGLVHRDIKPANILLSGETERAVITDFGLARAADDATITRAGMLTGTPQYMAPEQARGEHVDASSDLFSLGSVLYAMLVGHPPVLRETGTETIHVVGSTAPGAVRDIRPDLPEWIDRLAGKLHAFDSQKRMTDANEAARLLSSALAHAQDSNQNPLPVELRITKTTPRLMFSGIAVCGVVVALAVIFWPQLNLPSPNESGVQESPPVINNSPDLPGKSVEPNSTGSIVEHRQNEGTLDADLIDIEQSLLEIEQWLNQDASADLNQHPLQLGSDK